MTEYAFPMTVKIDDESTGYQAGMTLRDWFATQASEVDIREFQEWHHVCDGRTIVEVPKYTREQAKYLYADAMLEARK